MFVRSGRWDHVVELLTDRADASGRARLGVAVLHPYSIAVCASNRSIVVFDSHSHGQDGDLVATAQLHYAATYLNSLFPRYYPIVQFGG